MEAGIHVEDDLREAVLTMFAHLKLVKAMDEIMMAHAEEMEV
ncbi:hypothetical protein [Cytobacillus sp. NCCP-133]|nr:hypothetical protein [Cytobacillus sp. NCCP-133]GLB59005.1 hypothetical protein NCCP133_11380 [Cytobacillus sp. NCCP-133]